MSGTAPTIIIASGVDWPAIAASISTGVAALAGIGGTIWVATRSWRREDKRANTAEKRRIYASAAAALNNAYRATDRYGSAPNELLPARSAAVNALAELSLIVPNGITRLGWEAFIRLSSEAAVRPDWRGPASLAIGNLINAMRLDLGEPPVTTVIESLTPQTAGQAPDTSTVAETPVALRRPRASRPLRTSQALRRCPQGLQRPAESAS